MNASSLRIGHDHRDGGPVRARASAASSGDGPVRQDATSSPSCRRGSRSKHRHGRDGPTRRAITVVPRGTRWHWPMTALPTRGPRPDDRRGDGGVGHGGRRPVCAARVGHAGLAPGPDRRARRARPLLCRRAWRLRRPRRADRRPRQDPELRAGLRSRPSSGSGVFVGPAAVLTNDLNPRAVDPRAAQVGRRLDPGRRARRGGRVAGRPLGLRRPGDGRALGDGRCRRGRRRRRPRLRARRRRARPTDRLGRPGRRRLCGRCDGATWQLRRDGRPLRGDGRRPA